MAALPAGVEPVESEEPSFLSFCVFEDLFDAPAAPGEEMNPQFWSCLSEELVEKVLLVLPASSQARFRAVCKAWLNLLMSEPFRTRSAALAFSRSQYVCGVSHSMNEDASQLRNSRYKVHKVSLEFLPSEFQGRTVVLDCQQGLAVITGVVWPSYTSCVVNPVNQTYRVLPVLGFDWQPVSVVCVEENGEGKFSFRAYTDETSEDSEADEDESAGWFWAVYSSDKNEWEDMAMCIKTERTHESAVSMVKDAFCIARGWRVVYMSMYDRKSGELVHSFPPWQQQAVVQVNFMVQDEQVVALAASTTAENVCEMWKVDASSSSSAWMRVGAMPHGVLWPLDDVHFFSVCSVEVVGSVAFINVLGLDRPVHTWEEYDDWIGDCPSYPTHGFLVAFDLVQASWKLVCDRWPWKSRHVMQPNSAIDLSWRGT